MDFSDITGVSQIPPLHPSSDHDSADDEFLGVIATRPSSTYQL